MPRKNTTPSHRRYNGSISANKDAAKRRYANERLARAAADEAMLLTFNLELDVYRGIDGGWYLTSKKPS